MHSPLLSGSKTFESSQQQALDPLSSKSPSQPLATTNPCSISMDLHSMDILYERNHTVLCDWFLSLSIMLLRFINSIIIIMYHYFITFYCHIIFLCMHIQFVYPFVHWWTLGLLLPFGNCEQCLCECVYTGIWVPAVKSIIFLFCFSSSVFLLSHWFPRMNAGWVGDPPSEWKCSLSQTRGS